MPDRHDGPMGAIDKAMDKAGGMMGKMKAGSVSDPDTFAREAAIGNRYEIEAARIAERRAREPRVRAFAGRMIKDHEHARSEFETTLSSHPESPVPPEGLDSRREQMIEHLEKAPDEDFDQRYMEQQDLAHQETVKLFDSFADDGKHAGLQRFAYAMLPTLRGHLDEAQTLRKTLKDRG